MPRGRTKGAQKTRALPNQEENMSKIVDDQDAINAAIEAKAEALAEEKFAERLAAIEERLAKAAAGTDNSDFVKKMFEGFTQVITDISPQGVGVQKPVAPEILRAREEAHKKMVALIKDARELGEIPLYRLRTPVFLDEAYVVETWVDSTTHIRHPTDIEWPGVPNLSMVPLNDWAKKIHGAFLESIGNKGQPTKQEELSVANRGLKVRGEKRHEPAPLDPNVSPYAAEYQGLKVKHKARQGQTRLTHILGTIATPAEVSN